MQVDDVHMAQRALLFSRVTHAPPLAVLFFFFLPGASGSNNLGLLRQSGNFTGSLEQDSNASRAGGEASGTLRGGGEEQGCKALFPPRPLSLNAQ